MKLYNVPRNTWIKLPNGTEIFFKYLDGLYSYCKNENDDVVHINANADVEIL